MSYFNFFFFFVSTQLGVTQFFLLVHRDKKLSHFDFKSLVTGGTKIRLGKVSSRRIFESIGLSMLSQFDSNILQLPTLPGRILLVPPVTQLFILI